MAYTVHAPDVVGKDGKIIGGIVDTVLKNPGDKAALQAAINAWNMAANAARESAIADNDAATKASYEQQKEQWIAEAVAEKDARIAELESQVAALTPAPVPEGVTVRTPLEILGLLTEAEYAAIRAASGQSPAVARWYDMLRAASEVRSDDVRTQYGCAAMVLIGLFTAERVLEIFGVALE